MSSCGDTNDFIIPKGLDFDFTVQILQEDSFLPQKLDGFLNGTFKLITTATGANAGLNDVVLSKLTEDIVDPIVLVEEETELTVAVSEAAIYSITINGTTYSVDYTAGAVATTVVGDALAAVMGVLPQDVAIVHTAATAVITIKNTIGQVNTITYSTNIAKTNYIPGVEAVAGYTKTTYNDNGYLQGTITAAQTALLDVARGEEIDRYYLKSLYQGVLQVNFSDSTLDKTALVCSVYVVYTGV